MEILLPTMRKLPFTSEVKKDVTAREDMKAMLIKEIDADMTPGEFRAGELGMKVLGFVPSNFNLKEALVQDLLRGNRAFLRPQDEDDAPHQRSPREAQEAPDTLPKG